MEVPHPALSDTDGSSSMGTGESVFFAHCLSSAHFGSTGKEGEAAPPLKGDVSFPGFDLMEASLLKSV